MARPLPLVATVACLTLLAAPAEAYVGPGLGLSAIGVLLALIAAVLFTIAGFIWYPLKKLLRMARRSERRRQPG